MAFLGDIFVGEKIHFGGYVLSRSQIDKISNYKPLTLDKGLASNAANVTRARLHDLHYDDLSLEGNYLIAR